VLPPFETDGAEAQRLLDGVPVRYLVLDATSTVRRYAEGVVGGHASDWELVFSTIGGGTRIYKRTRTPAAGGS